MYVDCRGVKSQPPKVVGVVQYSRVVRIDTLCLFCYVTGAFLIPYFLYLFVMGMPLVMLEFAYGQFSSLSPIAVWKMAPLFEGTPRSFITYTIRRLVLVHWCCFCNIFSFLIFILFYFFL